MAGYFFMSELSIIKEHQGRAGEKRGATRGG
jgi:hypothetical protein